MNKATDSRLTYTILSISLLTVMAGAAMAPALGEIREHFSTYDSLTVQLIVSLPALFIVGTNLAFGWLCRLMKTRTLAVAGLCLYVLAGAGSFRGAGAQNAFRAFLRAAFSSRTVTSTV